MKYQPEKIQTQFFYFLIAIAILFCIFVFNSKGEDVIFGNEPFYEINNNWIYTDANGKESLITLPIKLNAGEDKQTLISHILPDDLTDLSTLCIRTSQQSIKAYIDHELIYSFGNDEAKRVFGKSSGSGWNIINLPKNSENKKITLEITSAYTYYSGVINTVYGGTKASILLHLSKIYGLSFILSVFIFIIGICLIIVYLIFKKLLNENKAILYLGWFSILVSIWMLGESKMTQFFIGNQIIVSSITFLSLMTFPIALLLYISTIYAYRFKKLLSYLIYLLYFNTSILILLQLYNITDFYEAVLFLHISTISFCIIILITLFVELFKYSNNHIKPITIALLVLCVLSIVELIFFYTKATVHVGNFIRAGVVFFIITLSWEAIQKSINIIKLSKSAQHYEVLATKDSITNCKNRTAFTRKLDTITADQKIGILLIDINNLKHINDTYGHLIGDDAIIRCSKCLESISRDNDTCYRTGGDEFVYLAYDCTKDVLKEKAEKFIQACEMENSKCNYEFKVAIGYALYDQKVDTDINHTLRRADKNMYEVKSNMKKK